MFSHPLISIINESLFCSGLFWHISWHGEAMFLLHIIWKTVGAIYNQQNACVLPYLLLVWYSLTAFLNDQILSCFFVCCQVLVYFFFFFFWEALPSLLGFYFLHAACRWTIQEPTLVAVFSPSSSHNSYFLPMWSIQLCKRLSFPAFKSVFPRQGLRHQNN